MIEENTPDNLAFEAALNKLGEHNEFHFWELDSGNLYAFIDGYLRTFFADERVEIAVAKALFANSNKFSIENHLSPDHYEWDDIGFQGKNEYIGDAKAAIEALKVLANLKNKVFL